MDDGVARVLTARQPEARKATQPRSESTTALMTCKAHGLLGVHLTVPVERKHHNNHFPEHDTELLLYLISYMVCVCSTNARSRYFYSSVLSISFSTSYILDISFGRYYCSAHYVCEWMPFPLDRYSTRRHGFCILP